MIDKDLASIGHIPVSGVSALALLVALRKMEELGIVSSAYQARGLAGQVFCYAIATRCAERNPAVDLTGALERVQTQHFASIILPSKMVAYACPSWVDVAKEMLPVVDNLGFFAVCGTPSCSALRTTCSLNSGLYRCRVCYTPVFCFIVHLGYSAFGYVGTEHANV